MQRNMIKTLMSVFILISTQVSAQDRLKGDVEKGQALSATCVACHGMDGNSINPIWPSLAGQHEAYLDRQLRLFRGGQRENALMAPMSAGLSDQDIADLSAYYASQTAKLQAANPELVELGRNIYQGGDKERNIPACMACHGPTGLGNPMSEYPVLANQHAAYTAIQLRAYKAGQVMSDSDDVNGQIMSDVARYMTEEEIDAVASYVQGLQAGQ